MQGDMPPPARGCLRRGGHVPEGQAGVAGATPSCDQKNFGTTAAGRPGAAVTARPGCGELNPKGSPPRPAVAGEAPKNIRRYSCRCLIVGCIAESR